MREVKMSKKRFEKLQDGWVRDLNTGLEWGPTSDQTMTHADAIAYCKKQGARLPTREELQSILDLKEYDPAVDKKAFPDTKSSWYWTSDICAWNKSYAWCVDFSSGSVFSNGKDVSTYVRP